MQEFEEHDYLTKKKNSDLKSFFIGIGAFFLIFTVAVFGFYGYRKTKAEIQEKMDEENEITEYEYLYGETEDDTVFQEDNTYADWDGMPPEKIKESYKTEGDVCVYYLDDKIGYRLFVTDAACGSRFYDFEKTTDGGYHWKVVNENPFDDRTGVAREISFQNEDEGTITLQSPGDGDSWRITMKTVNGGHTFQLEEEEEFE